MCLVTIYTKKYLLNAYDGDLEELYHWAFMWRWTAVAFPASLRTAAAAPTGCWNQPQKLNPQSGRSQNAPMLRALRGKHSSPIPLWGAFLLFYPGRKTHSPEMQRFSPAQAFAAPLQWENSQPVWGVSMRNVGEMQTFLLYHSCGRQQVLWETFLYLSLSLHLSASAVLH